MLSPVGKAYFGKRTFDQPGSFATLKSRKKLVATVCILASVFFVVRRGLPLPEPRTSHTSSQMIPEKMEIQSEARMPVRDAASAPSVSEFNTSVKGDEKEFAPATAQESSAIRESEAVKKTENAPVGHGITQGKPGKCLKHVLYDKPVKTGSTAISFAIREYLALSNERDWACAVNGPFSCVERAKSICNGTVEEKDHFSILGHLRWGGRELAECLRPNFYVVTSVREPYQRRKSAYLWNRTLNATHFKIPHTAPFKEFMNRMPRCQLYHYYDGRGWDCDVGMSLEERLEDIVSRVDEVIDIYDEPAGPLHKLIAGFLRRENESIKLDEKEYLEDFDHDTLKEEQMLYDRLRAKRLEPPNKNRLPC